MRPLPAYAWLRRAGLLLILAGLSSAGAETRNIVAEGTSEACWGREAAVKIARVDTSNDAHAECRALGKGWRYGSESFAGYVQCNRCGQSDEFRCTIKQAVHTCVNPQKEQEEAAAKKRAEQATQQQADKDQADRERIKQQMADREKAAKAAAAKGAREAAPSPSGAANDPLDQAFSKRLGQANAQKSTGGSGDVLGDALQQRAERLAERERQTVLKARTETATASCQAAAKGVDACLQSTCGSEPAKTHCTDGSLESSSCTPSPGSKCLSIPIYVCRATGPNPAHEKWQACTTTSRAQCALPGTVEDCVRQRLQATK